jgi:hypothetical protein
MCDVKLELSSQAGMLELVAVESATREEEVLWIALVSFRRST